MDWVSAWRRVIPRLRCADTVDVDMNLNLDEWIDARDAWLAEGKKHGYVASEVHCATHDGTPMTRGEEETLDDEYGFDDCVPIVRLGNEPGEEFIPRFGP